MDYQKEILEAYITLNNTETERWLLVENLANRLQVEREEEVEKEDIEQGLEELASMDMEIDLTEEERLIIAQNSGLNIYDAAKFAGIDAPTAVESSIERGLDRDDIIFEESDMGYEDEVKRRALVHFYDRDMNPEEIKDEINEELDDEISSPSVIKEWIKESETEFSHRYRDRVGNKDTLVEETRSYEVLDEIEDLKNKAAYHFLNNEDTLEMNKLANYFIVDLDVELSLREEVEILENSEYVEKGQDGEYIPSDDFSLSELEETILDHAYESSQFTG